MPTALIVEDEPVANKLLAMLVQLRGYRTESAFDGREALDKVDRNPPDVIFLDLMLPDVSGYDVCTALKNRKSTALIPVLMVTARIADENRARSHTLGAERYIAKPYTPDQIYEALDEVDAWRKADEEARPAGELPFDAAEACETLRGLARLHNRLLGLTRLDVGPAAAVTDALRGLAHAAGTWGRARGVRSVATLAYRLRDDGVEVTLRDLSGWLGDDLVAHSGPLTVAAAAFDEIHPDPSQKGVVMVKRFDGEDFGTR